MLRKKAELLKFVNAACDDYASEHSAEICEILERCLDEKTTPTFILNVFRRLYENEEYSAMLQLVTCIYNIDLKYCPYNIGIIQKNDVALIPYCDSLMEHLDNDITDLNIKLLDDYF